MISTLVKPSQFDKKLDKFFCLIMKRCIVGTGLADPAVARPKFAGSA